MWAWILGAVGALGVGGSIAALVFIPGLAPIAADIAIKMLATVSRAITAALTWFWRQVEAAPYLTAVMAVIVVMAWAWSGHHYYSQATTACEAAHKAAAAQEGERQTVAITGAKDASEPRTDEHAKQDQSNKQQVKHVTETIAARPDGGDVCIDAASVDGLRQIH